MAREKIEGTADLIKSLESLEKKIGNALLRRGLRAATKRLADFARLIVPVLTGALKKSIKTRAAKRKKNFYAYFVQSKLPYTPSIEYGRLGKEGQSFLRVAFDHGKDAAQDILIETINQGIDEAFKK